MRLTTTTPSLALALALTACSGDDAATTDTGTGTDTSSTGTTTSASTTSAGTTSAGTMGETTTSGSTSGTTDATTSGSTSGTATDATTGSTTDVTTSGTSGTTGTSTTGGIVDDSIYDVQEGMVVEGMMVDVKGVVVTAIDEVGLFVQETAGGEYSGAWVYVGKMGPDISGLAIGDEVDVVGVYGEYMGLTEIDASAGMVLATGVKDLPVIAEVVDLATLGSPDTAEPWECVFVRIEGMPLDVIGTPGFDEFIVSDKVSMLYVDEMMYDVFLNPMDFPNFGVGGAFTAIQGPLNYTFDNFKVAPRMLADLEGYVAPPKLWKNVDELVAGELVVTEVMYNPASQQDPDEWFEVLNKSGGDVNLKGLVVQDSAKDPMTQGVVNVDVILADGEYAWLAKGTMMVWMHTNQPDAFFGTKPDYGNAGDKVVIRNKTIILDETATWPNKGAPANGVSWHLMPDKLDATANDTAANWCYSTMTFDATMEKGTPKAVNEVACAMI